MARLFRCMAILAISTGTALGGERKFEPTAVDHVVYAAPDVEAESRRIAMQLGVSATAGGNHPGRGTVNALISLGANQYLEIIGPDPKLPRPIRAGARIAKLASPEVLTFAVPSSQLARIEAKAKELGLKTSGIRSGSRRTTAGDLLQWRTLGVSAGKEYGGLMPFFIDWGDTPHPATTSPQGARLVSLVVEHPEPDRLRDLFRELGVGVPVQRGSQRSIVAEIESGANRVSLRGAGHGL